MLELKKGCFWKFCTWKSDLKNNLQIVAKLKNKLKTIEQKQSLQKLEEKKKQLEEKQKQLENKKKVHELIQLFYSRMY